MAFARKISGGSKDLPPSYSKVDLTTIGLSLDDHLNPPPNYDRATELRDHHRKSGVIIPPLSERSDQQVSRFSITSIDTLNNNDSTVVSIEQPQQRRSTQRVSFLPTLEIGPSPCRTTSLPLVPAIKVDTKKRSVVSEGGQPGSRRVSFLEDNAPNPEVRLSNRIQMERADSIETYSSSNNLNSQPTTSPMI